MRTSYTVTLHEEPPAAPFPALAKELRPHSPLSPSLLLSTFVGLLLNKAKGAKNGSLQVRLKTIHESRKNLSSAEKQVYIQLAKDDKAHYYSEIKSWEEQMVEVGREDRCKVRPQSKSTEEY